MSTQHPEDAWHPIPGEPTSSGDILYASVSRQFVSIGYRGSDDILVLPIEDIPALRRVLRRAEREANK